MVMDPDILIYDEPFVGLDPISMGVIVRLVRKMNDALGITSIIVSHRVSTLASADHIAVLDRGRLVQFGTHEELLATDGFYQEVALLQRLTEERRHAGTEHH